MPAPVWVLSVDLQARTAAFSTGMADAARSAKGSLSSIQSDADKAGERTSFSMKEARHSVMILGEGFGVHIPRALAGFMASLGPMGPALEAAFPLAAIALGIGIFVEHLKKIKEEQAQLTIAQEKFGTATHRVFSDLEKQLLEAGIKTDELSGNHMAALHKQLQLIDHQTLEDLAKQFDIVSKAADVVFENLKMHWYSQGIGATGAKHALESFHSEYEALLAAPGKAGEASDLLHGTLGTARHVLDAMNEIKKYPFGGNIQDGSLTKYQNLVNTLKDAGVTGTGTKEEVEAQRKLVATLETQVTIEKTLADLADRKKGNTRTETGNKMGAEDDAAFKRQADEEKRELDVQDQRRTEARTRAISELQQGEREKIEITQRGTEARLSAIQDAMKEEEKWGLYETEFYKALGLQKIQVEREIAEERARLTAEAGKEAADHELRMGELELEAQRITMARILSGTRLTEAQREKIEKDAEQRDYKLKMDALKKQADSLDRSAKDYENKLKQIHHRQEELTKQHENKITEIKDRAQKERNGRILRAEQQGQDMIASELARTILRHQTWGQMVLSIGDQIAQGMLQNAIKSMLTLDMTKEKEAAAAARKAYLAGWHFPFPANIVMAPVMGAAAFAAVMAFAEGGLVPGQGSGDTVPAMLTPGEHVADKRLTQGLQRMVDNGGQTKAPIHVTINSNPTLSSLDDSDMDRVLDKHEDRLARKFERIVRKMNRN